MTFGFRNLQNLGKQLSISILPDAEGFLGRECPAKACEGYFKIKPGTGLTGPKLPCHCPYCGHTGSPQQFWTKDQVEYAKSVAMRKVTDAVHKDFKSLEFASKSPGSSGIGISLRVEKGRSTPIRYYREKALETCVVCSVCTLEYAIYGVFGYCPDCRSHNSMQILEKNHDLISKQLALAASVQDGDLRQYLIEDALENCVSAFDGFGREACRIRASAGTNPSKCEKISFQNLIDASTRLKDLFGIDLASGVSPTDWSSAHRGFMKRHVLAHRSGVVDARYLAETSDTSAIVGRRVPVDAAEVNEFALCTKRIAQCLIASLPPLP